MTTWLSLIVTALKIIGDIVGWAKERKQYNAGVDAEIARASAAILGKTNEGKRIMAEIQAMSEEEVTEVLSRLEPK